MNPFKNLKIGMQLSLAFGMLTALILIMAAITLTGISSIGQAVNQIDKISADRLGPLYQAREALAQTGLAARNAYIFTDEAQAKKELALVDEQKAIYLTALNELTPVYGDDAEFAKVRTGLLAMAEALKRPRQLREAGNMNEFSTFLVNECSPLRRQIVSDMAVVVKKTQQQMDDATLLSASRSATPRQLSIIVATIAFVVSLLTAGLIKRMLLKQLGGEPAYAAEIANKIARGELGIRVETKQNDKSSLLFAIKTMRDSLASILLDRSGTAPTLSAAHRAKSPAAMKT